jgi:hypothetical protein
MIRTFLDESGIHDEARICVIAGFVGSARQWERFERRWAAIGEDAKSPGFHSKSFFAKDPNGQRVPPYRGWTEDRALSLINGVVKAISQTDVHPIVAGVNVEAFRQYTEKERRVLTGAALSALGLKGTGCPTKPYFLVFQDIIFQALDRLKRLDWKVDFVFDQQTVFEGFALELYGQLNADDDKWSRRMGDISFRSRTNVPQLQAADLLAYCWYQLSSDRTARKRAYIKPVLDALESKDYEAHFWSKESMDKSLGRAPRMPGKAYQVRI